MPPPRRPRDRLARLLRATADRLATPPTAPPPHAAPEPAPRRPGEPPEHWLRLVATHAPGLLHDLAHPTPTPPTAAPPVDQEVWVGSDAAADANLLIDQEGAGERGRVDGEWGAWVRAGAGAGRWLPLRSAVPGALGEAAARSAPLAGDGIAPLAGDRLAERARAADGTAWPAPSSADAIRGLSPFPADDAARDGFTSRDAAGRRRPLDIGWGPGARESATRGSLPGMRGASSAGEAGRDGSRGDAGASRRAATAQWSSGAAGVSPGSPPGRTGAPAGPPGHAGAAAESALGAGPLADRLRAGRNGAFDRSSSGGTGAPAGSASGGTGAPAGSASGGTGAPAGSASGPSFVRQGPSSGARPAAPPGWVGALADPSAGAAGSGGARPGGGPSGWGAVPGSAAGAGLIGRPARVTSTSDAGALAVLLADAAPGRLRPGPPADAPGIAGTGMTRAADLRVHPLSLGRQQTHPNSTAPAHPRGTGGEGWPRPDRPYWTGAAAGPWPALPAEAGEQASGRAGGAAGDGAGGVPRRDPWPALPDDRELWTPAVTARDADRLARLDREQAGD